MTHVDFHFILDTRLNLLIYNISLCIFSHVWQISGRGATLMVKISIEVNVRRAHIMAWCCSWQVFDWWQMGTTVVSFDRSDPLMLFVHQFKKWLHQISRSMIVTLCMFKKEIPIGWSNYSWCAKLGKVRHQQVSVGTTPTCFHICSTVWFRVWYWAAVLKFFCWRQNVCLWSF